MILMNPFAPKTRLDSAIFERKLARSRSQAAMLIAEGKVKVNGIVATKASMAVDAGAVLEVTPAEFVGRGGQKLAHALKEFKIDPTGLTCADVGSSTGGFTDCLLQRGARKVYAIDVGTGQLDATLRSDARVVVMESTDIRTVASLPEPIDLAVIDVSFISLSLVLPPVKKLLAPAGRIITLIKPQFEVGKGRLGKQGVVKDEAARAEAIAKIEEYAKSLGFEAKGVIPSPITGETGNVEYLFYASASSMPPTSSAASGSVASATTPAK